MSKGNYPSVNVLFCPTFWWQDKTKCDEKNWWGRIEHGSCGWRFLTVACKYLDMTPNYSCIVTECPEN